jgi:ribosomal protein S18 acetylase RimI-like enzyme
LPIPGVAGILSPPLLPNTRPAWEQAGFSLRARLLLLRRELPPPEVPEHPITLSDEESLVEVQEVDRAAFDSFWRLNMAGLQEALTATPHRAIHLCHSAQGTLAGFAITGAGSSLAYLQRLAVHPEWQSRGIGSSLLCAAAAWAAGRGASALLLNTPAENQAAASFYRSAGFRPVTRDLAVLGRRA